MKLLKEIIRRPDINFDGKLFYREAVRGIIPDGRKLLMIYSEQGGDYKFPGGGIEQGETYEDALTREIREESGAAVTDIVKEFGRILEYDRPLEPEYDVFKMASFYYVCKVDKHLGEQKLDDYEAELGFRPVWIDIDAAISANKEIVNSPDNGYPRWTLRETCILQLIKDELLQP